MSDGEAANAFDPSTQAGGSLEHSRPAWSTLRVLEKPELHSWIRFQTSLLPTKGKEKETERKKGWEFLQVRGQGGMRQNNVFWTGQDRTDSPVNSAAVVWLPVPVEGQASQYSNMGT